MKTQPYLFLFATIVLLSCTDRAEEKAIKDFVQTIGDSKFNLDMAIIEISHIGNVIGRDSVMFIDSILYLIAKETKFKYELDKYQLESEIEGKELQQRYETFPNMKKVRAASIEARRKQLLVINEALMSIDSGVYDNLNLTTMSAAKVKKRYAALPNKVLALKYRCRYKIKNPQLNNVEQETTKVFVLDTLKMRVLSVL